MVLEILVFHLKLFDKFHIVLGAMFDENITYKDRENNGIYHIVIVLFWKKILSL